MRNSDVQRRALFPEAGIVCAKCAVRRGRLSRVDIRPEEDDRCPQQRRVPAGTRSSGSRSAPASPACSSCPAGSASRCRRSAATSPGCTEGKLTRTYGGAIAREPAPEASLRHRIGEDLTVKRRIARCARAQVRTGETVLLDAGSTVGALAHDLRDAEHLTVAGRW
ncbi:hypothetical protein GCM10011581_40320 [Saccharopolyspora subtropica]|uniref:DeoR-like transcriptional repressor C-terminal sensor domain-containing protein n=1 Tax=Saccharopolyspora thermophila TaxID=89367 RepID=A0A917NGP5_9PSEU|nr:hypothetical protein GCM10011581_40320 [Saccharopolyspora subtropica]